MTAMCPSLYGGVINRMRPNSKKISLTDCEQIGKEAVRMVDAMPQKDAEERAYLLALTAFKLKSKMFRSLL